MPIFVAPSGTGPGGYNPPPVFPLEVPAVTWTDARGRTTELGHWENGWILQPGIRGFDMPAYQFYTDESPAIDGNALRGVRAQAREVFLPVTFFDSSRADFMSRKRSFLATLNPKLGPGTITATEVDGSTRTISAYYASGAEGDFGQDTSGMRWQTVGLTFSCPSPYWLGGSVHAEFGGTVAGNWFPLLPLTVRNPQVIGNITIDNPGDDVGFPVWTITGPITNATITNNTTGESFTISASMLSTDTLVIDTRERVQTAVLNGTTNWWPNLTTSSVLWGLTPGVNDIDLSITGSTSHTKVEVDYQPRFLTA
ncbi:phage distal tail protein [Streptomyces sp. CA-106131]|uniref:phage distal tail protein n=1 Tax=Streptomyces sp. CA-106131 TaxID=3240045 RepID=UPI003D8F53C6